MKKATKLRGLMLLCLVALFAASPALLSPPAACALGIIETETFYNNAAHSMVVGKCVENSCLGTYTCTGTTSNYSTTTIRSCAGGGV